ncbi:hypothetical protein [Acuticoccus kandeliae]|uniref:hypothetical protein n=1 Tax=Acuticoccus kandeliae TaxID=2073160 RepID=UPI000D3E4545|nr:hypothetical protein [Acuticoccus kandeliae]
MTTRREATFGLSALALAALPPAPAQAAPAEAEATIRDLYRRFAAAQNARDLAGVRAFLWDSPDFLWVSDGRPYFGPDAMIERMGQFQRAPVWRVTPDLAGSRVVALAPGAAYLFLSLLLEIGPEDAPSRLPWLVGVVCREGETGWRIAALFTTTDKTA